MFDDTFFDYHLHHQQHSTQTQQQYSHQTSWCSPAHFTSHLFQNPASSTFQPASFTSPSSFGTSSLARMESTFCKNFVCCSIPLDDLHDLLEHYEQAHCHQSSTPTGSNDSNSSNTHRPDLVVFEDEDEWSGTESASTNLSNRPSCNRSASPPDNWSTSKDSSNSSRRKSQHQLWSKAEDGFGIPPSLLDGQNSNHSSTSYDPNNFLMMIDVDEDGSSSNDSDRNHLNRCQSDSSQNHRSSSEQRDWESSKDKPYKCSVPGCEKAYKQPNGLKYHQAHGHCSQKIMSLEEELKTFVCHDAVCSKRYKNINGLRYHYQHTGPHGTIGLQLLSLGLHPSGPAANLSNFNTHHPHRHPLLTSAGSICNSSSLDGGSISGLTSESPDVTMND